MKTGNYPELTAEKLAQILRIIRTYRSVETRLAYLLDAGFAMEWKYCGSGGVESIKHLRYSTAVQVNAGFGRNNFARVINFAKMDINQVAKIREAAEMLIK